VKALRSGTDRRPAARDPQGTIRLHVPAAAAGGRLDRYLAEHVAGWTRSALGRLIREGGVTVDGAAASKTGLPLEEGMEIAVALPPSAPGGPGPESIPLDIIFEDEALIVVNKPSGLVVHPGHGRRDGTLVNALLGRGTPLSPRGAPDRPGIVHRLDRETSGLVIVAKTEAAHATLSAAFSRRAIHKRYLALVWGHPDPAEGLVEKRVGRSRSNPLKMAVGGRSGREAITRYSTTERLPGFSFLTLYPETGRTHQIRVHLQSIHHPIVGDGRYGGRMGQGVQNPRKRGALARFAGIALHASGLTFEHPLTRREIRLAVALPAEFETLLGELRRD